LLYKIKLRIKIPCINLTRNKEKIKNWNYHNAFFFAGTLATTIGYGNVVPKTNEGRIFCLFFVMIGKFGINLNKLE